jgi:glycosyltransferase involved in cell wall biosynthesis
VNVLFVDQFSQPGGAQQCLMELLPEVLARGWKAFLIAPGNEELVRRCREWEIPVHSLPLGSYTSGRKTMRDMLRFTLEVPRMRGAIRRAIAQHDIDLVFVNGPRALPAVAGTGRPVVFHAHSPIGGTLPRMLAERSVARTGAHVIAVSKFVARRYPAARVIYNGVPDYGIPGRSLRKHTARVGIVGRIAREKGHLDFIRAAHSIARESAGTRFFVYGERLFSEAGYERSVRAAAEGAPIEFCGWKSDAGATMRELDILVVPSDPSEAATRVIMEAFSAGTPVVAYRSGGIPELVEDGRTGVLVNWPDRESLARNVLSLMADPARMDRFSLAGRSEWDLRFRIRRFQKSVCDFMEEAMINACGRATFPAQPSEGRTTAATVSHERDTQNV